MVERCTSTGGHAFTYNEGKCLISNLGFTVALKTDFEQNKISERMLKVVFCKTNGNPRFITRYIRERDLGYMLTTLDKEYRSMVKADGLGGRSEINTSLVAFLKTGTCHLGSTPSVIGGAFCTNARGTPNAFSEIHESKTF